MRISIMMVEDWINSWVSNPRDSNAKLQECYEQLRNIANDEYKPKELRDDIEAHDENQRSSR